MKRISLAVLSCALMLVMGSVPASAMTADEVIAKSIEAIGGKEKLAAVKSKKMIGRTLMQGMEFPFTVQQKPPNLFRVDVSVQGIQVVQAFDGKTAWQISPQSGGKAEVMSPIQATTFRNQANFNGPLVDYKEMGFKAELVGKEEVEGTSVYHLKLAPKNDSVKALYGDFTTHIYVDADTFLEMKMTITGEMEGNAFEVDIYPSDYRKVDGLILPHSIEIKSGGQTITQQVIDKIELNVDVADSLFKMPEG